jgi:hypothetical protein
MDIKSDGAPLFQPGYCCMVPIESPANFSIAQTVKN